MRKVTKEDGLSADIISENADKLKKLFPDAFTENGINFETLRQTLGDASILDEGEEKFGLNWFGKKKARQISLIPSIGTLRPIEADSVNWKDTKNILIEGDNLEVLKLLRKSYGNQVDLIYIDPPYNTDKDFIYPDRFSEGLEAYLKYTGQKADDGSWALSQSGREKTGRKHTNWLNMMYARLSVCKHLLKNKGVFMTSIGPEEVSNLISICNEVFGEENKVSVITWEKGRKNDSTYFSESVEYLLVYAKNLSAVAEDGLWRERKPGIDLALDFYKNLRKETDDHNDIENKMRGFYDNLDDENPTKELRHFYRSDKHGLYFGGDISSASTSIPDYEIPHPKTGKPCKKPSRGWGCNPDEMERRISDNRVHFGEDETTIPLKKNYLFEVDSIVKTPVIYKDGRAATRFQKNIFGDVVFENPKDHEVLADLFSYCKKQGGTVLDFFAGSGSTGHSAWLSSLAGVPFRFILVQIPELLSPSNKKHRKAIAKGYKTIADVSKARLKLTALTLKKDSVKDIDYGFRVFKLTNSNIKVWNPDRLDLESSLLTHKQSILDDRSEQDVLYELLLKRGLDLSAKIEEKSVLGKTVFAVEKGALFVCLTEEIKREDADAIANEILKWHSELKPENTQVFFRDSAFHDDNVTKSNIVAILEQNGIHHVRSL